MKYSAHYCKVTQEIILHWKSDEEIQCCYHCNEIGKGKTSLYFKFL